MIRHYALDSKHKTQEALFVLDKFSTAGITGWIQEITHWHGNAVPRTGIVTDFNTIETLMDKRLDGSSYRVYLVLQKAIRLRSILSADEIMERAGISRSAYTTAVTKLDELQLLPDWCKIQRKAQPERAVRDRLQSQLGGKVEAYTKFGLIDLLTETSHRNKSRPSLERRDRPHPSQKRKISKSQKTIASLWTPRTHPRKY